MALRATTVRFSEELWRQLEGESEREGVSAAQFVRDAAMLRIAFLAGRRGDDVARASVEELADQARRRASAVTPDPVRDPVRLRALRATGLLDRRPDPAFERLSSLTARLLHAPVALVSLVEEDRQFFASCVGLSEPWASRRETPMSHSFCQHPVRSRRPLLVSDAREHPLVRENLAIRDLGVIAYAGMPLVTDDGHALGALCAIDTQPRTWTTPEVELLGDLAASVVSEIELRRNRTSAKDRSAA